MAGQPTPDRHPRGSGEAVAGSGAADRLGRDRCRATAWPAGFGARRLWGLLPREGRGGELVQGPEARRVCHGCLAAERRCGQARCRINERKTPIGGGWMAFRLNEEKAPLRPSVAYLFGPDMSGARAEVIATAPASTSRPHK